MAMNRGTSRYHGCLSFLEYAGMDPVSGKFYYNSDEIVTHTPGTMQSDFMHARWGAKGDQTMLLGPGQGGVDPQPPQTPPKPHEHDYPDKPDADGKWRCRECKDVWNK